MYHTCPAIAALLQVRASLFAAVVGGLGECAALRHVAPEDPLWQQAAAGLVSVVNAGLPAVNIMFVNHHQPPENAWQVNDGCNMRRVGDQAHVVAIPFALGVFT
jgi:hypothetical protein